MLACCASLRRTHLASFSSLPIAPLLLEKLSDGVNNGDTPCADKGKENCVKVDIKLKYWKSGKIKRNGQLTPILEGRCTGIILRYFTVSSSDNIYKNISSLVHSKLSYISQQILTSKNTSHYSRAIAQCTHCTISL